MLLAITDGERINCCKLIRNWDWLQFVTLGSEWWCTRESCIFLQVIVPQAFKMQVNWVSVHFATIPFPPLTQALHFVCFSFTPYQLYQDDITKGFASLIILPLYSYGNQVSGLLMGHVHGSLLMVRQLLSLVKSNIPWHMIYCKTANISCKKCIFCEYCNIHENVQHMNIIRHCASWKGIGRRNYWVMLVCSMMTQCTAVAGSIYIGGTCSTL